MNQRDYLDLPVLLGGQHRLSAMLRETRDTIMYRATQSELRREVVVELLRFSAARSPHKIRMFLDTARVQASFQGEHLARVLEAVEVEGTWLVAREIPAGEPLDMMLAAGKTLPAIEICRLMIILCKLCLRLEAEKVASGRFHLEDAFYHEHDFRLSHPACVGTRSASASRIYLTDAARELQPLVATDSYMAGAMLRVLQRISCQRNNSLLQPALYLAELSRLFTLMLEIKPVQA